MSGVFISYRREDSGGYAGRLFDILSARFGIENTFMDLAGIRGGEDFVRVIEEKIGSCDVLLAVIGERWLTIASGDGTRRLEAAGDFVRLEIGKALERNVPVIPVLVGNATMPHQKDVPDDLRALALHQAMDVRDAHFREDADRLIKAIVTVAPGLGHRRWKSAERRVVPLAVTVLAVAAVAGGVLLLRHGTPVMHEAAAPTQTYQALGPNEAPPEAKAGTLVQPNSTLAAGSPRSLAKAKPVEAPLKVAGKWKAGVTYEAWVGVYPETFNFEVMGTELSGSAGFLGVDRGILDGKVEGNQISFMTKSVTEMDDKKYQDKHYYKGTVEGDTIRFTMNTDSEWFSEAPAHFTAKRVETKATTN